MESKRLEMQGGTPPDDPMPSTSSTSMAITHLYSSPSPPTPAFTVNSFTQNLSSALSDPTRSRAECRAFFTRHWGEGFTPLERIPSNARLPKITLEHFHQYLQGTGRKHKSYLKAKRALRRLLSRHSEQSGVDSDEIPELFYSTSFALHTFEYFSVVFLEPLPHEELDRLVSPAEERRRQAAAHSNNTIGKNNKPLPSTSATLRRPESSGSLASLQSLQNQVPIAAAQNRHFRPYRSLLERLEYYHNTVGVLLNYRLEEKSEEFWRTVNSYSALHGELKETIKSAEKGRQHLALIRERICERSRKCIELHHTKENLARVLHKLREIACLRDARMTVQFLLEQNSTAKALECIETVQEVLGAELRGVACFRHLDSQLREAYVANQQETAAFITRFHERKRQKLTRVLDSEQWKVIDLPCVYQQLVDDFSTQGVLRDITGAGARKLATPHPSSRRLALDACDSADGLDDEGLLPSSECDKPHRAGSAMSSTSSQHRQPGNPYIQLGEERFVVAAASLMLVRVLAQYCGVLSMFPQCAVELLLNVVEVLKNFNSRTCQLILGAGAIQLVGLKTISVKNLALASRSLQLVVRFVPSVRKEFADALPDDRQQMLRHFDQALKDYIDHVQEIDNKLLVIMDNHLISALNEWRVNGSKTPTPAFQLIVKQVGKFYSGYSAVMPPEVTTEMLHRIHANFKLYLKQHLQARGITPHDAVTYGMAGEDFLYYVENMKALEDCLSFPDDTLNDVLTKRQTNVQHNSNKNNGSTLAK